MRTVASSGSISSVSVSLCLQRASGTVRSVSPSIRRKPIPLTRTIMPAVVNRIRIRIQSSILLRRSGNTHRWHSMLMDLLPDWRECHRHHQQQPRHFPGCGAAAHNRKNAYYRIPTLTSTKNNVLLTLIRFYGNTGHGNG
uniref:Putative secreted peptide n=1 Tax=Anopheles braziliensis TaxID=58242 RepID=A0A2M3ZSS3_9DIPT